MPIGIFMQDFRTTRNHYVDFCPISTRSKPTFRATLRSASNIIRFASNSSNIIHHLTAKRGSTSQQSAALRHGKARLYEPDLLPISLVRSALSKLYTPKIEELSEFSAGALAYARNEREHIASARARMER